MAADKTVRVKLKTARVGDRVSQKPGDVVEVSPAEAERMLKSGQCEVLRDGQNYEKRS